MKKHYQAIGVMSGSSLDGIDLAWCEFIEENGGWEYSIREARTIQHTAQMRQRLTEVMQGSALDLARLHRDLGIAIGEECAELLQGSTIDVIGSHGHTIFHKPAEGLTTQIGCGAHIAAISKTTTVCDFRTMDVAYDGQGAPLVPLGEKLLFPEHKAFLNIGGICNISLHHADRIEGYDVCIGNQALNYLAEEAGERYDAKGAMARSGELNAPLLKNLNALPFHQQTPPRSLGREWFNEHVLPLINDRSIPLPDRMRTVVEHIALQLATALKDSSSKCLVTGGGAYNTFLMDRIRAHSGADLEIPGASVVEFKEALIFALLGVLRMRDENTALASVTGAKQNSVGGAVYSTRPVQST
ncbi:MAG: anhydro-N-acetylmuramic acid kinase [Flavobacteriales bacterium]|nr:anhydro-N-acetylmuramic acid kinase [Flavobacteriales bacterium]